MQVDALYVLTLLMAIVICVLLILINTLVINYVILLALLLIILMLLLGFVRSVIYHVNNVMEDMPRIALNVYHLLPISICYCRGCVCLHVPWDSMPMIYQAHASYVILIYFVILVPGWPMGHWYVWLVSICTIYKLIKLVDLHVPHYIIKMLGDVHVNNAVQTVEIVQQILQVRV